MIQYNTQYPVYTGFLSHGGTPSCHPFIDWFFHEITHPAIGIPTFMETSKWVVTNSG